MKKFSNRSNWFITLKNALMFGERLRRLRFQLSEECKKVLGLSWPQGRKVWGLRKCRKFWASGPQRNTSWLHNTRSKCPEMSSDKQVFAFSNPKSSFAVCNWLRALQMLRQTTLYGQTDRSLKGRTRVIRKIDIDQSYTSAERFFPSRGIYSRASKLDRKSMESGTCQGEHEI